MASSSPLTNLQRTHHPVKLISLTPRLKPISSSLSFKRSLKSTPIRASSSSSSSIQPQKTPHLLKSLSCITIAAAALFLSRFNRAGPPPALAGPVPTTTTTTTSTTQDSQDAVKEREIRERLSQNPDDAEALRLLMELKVKARSLGEAIEVIDRLIEVEPDEGEWPLLKANIHSYTGDLDLARNGFEDILSKDPLRVEAYHGLVMVVSQKDEGKGVLEDVVKRIEEAMSECSKLKRASEVRDFKLLLAQVRVIEGNYDEALKVYQELVKEEPKDFRPYLCEGIIYTLLGKKDEAEKLFEQYRRLVPKNHPYTEYFDDNMFSTKLFAQKRENKSQS